MIRFSRHPKLFLIDEAENFLKINCSAVDDRGFRYYLVRYYNATIINAFYFLFMALFMLLLRNGYRFTYSTTLLSWWRGLLTSEEEID